VSADIAYRLHIRLACDVQRYCSCCLCRYISFTFTSTLYQPFSPTDDNSSIATISKCWALRDGSTTTLKTMMRIDIFGKIDDMAHIGCKNQS